MPRSWPRKPDRRDPEFRRVEDRMNFIVHIFVFAAFNSGLWFIRSIEYADWGWVYWVSGIWGGILLAHWLYIYAIADYSPLASKNTPTKSSQG